MTFFSFSQTLIQSLTIQFQKKIAIIWKIKTVGVRAMKFGTVRIQFFGEDFRCRCRRGCFLFFCCCCCFLLVIFLSVVCDWHKFYAYFFFASYFHEKVVSILCYQDAGYGEKSLFSCDDDNDDSESKNIDDEVMTILLFWCDFKTSFFFLRNLLVTVVSSSRFAQRHGTPHEHLFLQWKENVSWLWQDLRTPPDVGRVFRTFGSPTSPWQTRYQLRCQKKYTSELASFVS